MASPSSSQPVLELIHGLRLLGRVCFHPQAFAFVCPDALDGPTRHIEQETKVSTPKFRMSYSNLRIVRTLAKHYSRVAVWIYRMDNSTPGVVIAFPG